MTSTPSFMLSEIFDEKDPSVLQNEKVHAAITAHINHLILNDFEGLMNILYRIDVKEDKLKAMLRLHPDTEAAGIIATLIINRQIEKLNTPEMFFDYGDDIPEEERW